MSEPALRRSAVAGAVAALILLAVALLVLHTTESSAASSGPTLSVLDGASPGASSGSLPGEFQDIHPDGAFTDARTTPPGLAVATYDGSICELDPGRGIGGCTNDFPDGVLFVGSEVREFDSPSAPFDLYFDGLAIDGISGLRVTTSSGQTIAVPVVGNAFSATLRGTGFDDIRSILAVHSGGGTTVLDPGTYFPRGVR